MIISTTTPLPYILPFAKNSSECKDRHSVLSQPRSLPWNFLIFSYCRSVRIKQTPPSQSPVPIMPCRRHDSGVLQECVSPCGRPVSVSTVALGAIPMSVGVTPPSFSGWILLCAWPHCCSCPLLMDAEVTSEQRCDHRCTYSSPLTPPFQFLWAQTLKWDSWITLGISFFFCNCGQNPDQT